jgi:hypothetical protein
MCKIQGRVVRWDLILRYVSLCCVLMLIQGRVVRSDLIDDLVSFLVTGRPETVKPPPIQKTVTTVTRTHIRFADSGLSLIYICVLCLCSIYVSSCYFRSVSLLYMCLSLFYICVLMLLQVCLSPLYVSSCYLSSCYCICVLILLYVSS